MKHFDTWEHIKLRHLHGFQFNCPFCKTIINSRDEGGLLPMFIRICRHMGGMHGASIKGHGIRSKIHIPEKRRNK